MDVLALFGWRTCRETPFKTSFSSASLPTRRSRAAMRASYSASTSAAAVSLSSPPASNLATQILIRLRPIPWRLARACSDSPPRNSWTTWRLNSIECVRCLAMGFLLESPVQLADSHLPHLSTPRGAPQTGEAYPHGYRERLRKSVPIHARQAVEDVAVWRGCTRGRGDLGVWRTSQGDDLVGLVHRARRLDDPCKSSLESSLWTIVGRPARATGRCHLASGGTGGAAGARQCAARRRGQHRPAAHQGGAGRVGIC